MNLDKKIDSITLAFLEALQKKGGKPIYDMTPQEARQALLVVQDVSTEALPVESEDKTIPVGPNGTLSITIFKPKNAPDNLPAIMFFHGGGWVLGDKKTHARFVSDLVHAAHVAAIFVNYTNSPEAKFPIPIEEAYAATRYVADNGKALRVDSSRIGLVGDSVGGNMVMAVALLAKERGGPKISFQVLFYPVTDANFETASYKEFADGPWLTKTAMKWFWNNYLPDESKRKEKIASPLQATLEDLRGLAPTLIMTNEFDVLRDEAEALAYKLTEAQVPVIAIRHLGAIHDSALINPLATTMVCKNSIETAAGFIRKMLDTQAQKTSAKKEDHAAV